MTDRGRHSITERERVERERRTRRREFETRGHGDAAKKRKAIWFYLRVAVSPRLRVSNSRLRVLLSLSTVF
ncbi:MAG: hypothetical protein AUG51_00760 [Acidobacteria bacterium 13_1_20CM_3_53_8]|nr:MAG: hypothetical protein AUG51_00760 [Acidobacteria bacterium 13_1_20CM_3_53_8]